MREWGGAGPSGWAATGARATSGPRRQVLRQTTERPDCLKRLLSRHSRAGWTRRGGSEQHASARGGKSELAISRCDLDAHVSRLRSEALRS